MLRGALWRLWGAGGAAREGSGRCGAARGGGRAICRVPFVEYAVRLYLFIYTALFIYRSYQFIRLLHSFIGMYISILDLASTY